MNMTKREMRKIFLEARRGMSEEERQAASKVIAGRIAGMPEYQKASTVLIYRALWDETDMGPLTEHPGSAGKRFAYPRCVSDTEMVIMIPGRWRRGRYGIMEPEPSVFGEVAPEDVDFVVCPGIAFDSGRVRLGAGGGYYDRFLPKCVNATVIMAAYEIQRAAAIPREDTDIIMERIVTEKGIY